MTPHDVKLRVQELSRAIAEAKAEGRDASDLIAQHQALRRQLTNGKPPPRKHGPPSLTLEVLTSLDGLPPTDYEDLLAESETVSPFMTLNWLEPWYAAYGGDYDLHLAVVRQGDRLLAALPLMIGMERRHGLRRRVARFVGTGPGLRGNYFSMPLRSGAAEQTGDLLNEHLESLLDSVTLVLQNLSPFADGTKTLRLLCRQPHRSISLTTQIGCVHGSLPDTFDKFIQSVPTATRRTSLRHGDAPLRQHGDVEYRVCRRSEQIPEFLDSLGRLSVQRRAREGQQSTWAVRQNTEAREQVCARFLADDRLRLELLTYDKKPIAALIGFVYNNIYFCYNMALDQAFSDYQPGHLLLAWRIRQSIDEGLTGFNFLVGDADYKRQYFRQVLPELTATVLPSRGVQHCFEGACQFLRGLRKL
ncbi:MAG: GNAT family N-acetyltransferase [Armatimonadia bacterium]